LPIVEIGRQTGREGTSFGNCAYLIRARDDEIEIPVKFALMKQKVACRLASICFLAICTPPRLASQQPPPPAQVPTIRVQSSLVLVDVFSRDRKSGLPVRDFKKNKLVDDFLETSGIVFGIRDSRSPNLRFLIGEQAKIMHYMAKHTDGEYCSVPPSGYEGTLDAILMQLHFRDELGFIPPAIDGKRHELRVELTKEARAEHNGLRLRYRPEYIPLREEPDWAH